MPILSIEKRILKPTFGYENFESAVPGETKYGDEIVRTQFDGLVGVIQYAPGMSYRKKANIEFPSEEAQSRWLDAENAALAQVGQHLKFIYRLRPDEAGNIEIFLYDSSLFQTLTPGMIGIIVGEVADFWIKN